MKCGSVCTRYKYQVVKKKLDEFDAHNTWNCLEANKNVESARFLIFFRFPLLLLLFLAGFVCVCVCFFFDFVCILMQTYPQIMRNYCKHTKRRYSLLGMKKPWFRRSAGPVRPCSRADCEPKGWCMLNVAHQPFLWACLSCVHVRSKYLFIYTRLLLLLLCYCLSLSCFGSLFIAETVCC